ncbi:unnamed protein product [Schistosoma curassoni]|uniref:Apoptosis-antagonizing transcription factor n=1 Tax=Schistosoma curassoni TaxID=6186 RepID=A0A183KRM9_9TREM|nr:unnamed protein product [Schistosoma curassoni]
MEIEVNIADDELPEDVKSQFMEYVTKITKERSNKKHIQLLEILENQPVENKFPTEPKKYVHDFSGTELNKEKLEVLALGLKLCDTRNHVNQIDTEIQFENLNRHTSDLIQERRKKKAAINTSRTRAEKDKAQAEYTAVNKQVKRSIRTDKRKYMKDSAMTAQKAVREGDPRELYDTTKKLSGNHRKPERQGNHQH